MSEFLIKPKVYFGTDALQSLNTLNARRVFVVTDQAMVKFGFAEQVLNLLEKKGIEYQVYADVASDPDISAIVNGMKVMDSHYPDAVVALGEVQSLMPLKPSCSPFGIPVRTHRVKNRALLPSRRPAEPDLKSPLFL